MAAFLEGKVVAITGGGGGIGRAVALAAANEGAKVLVADFGVGMAGEDRVARWPTLSWRRSPKRAARPLPLRTTSPKWSRASG